MAAPNISELMSATMQRIQPDLIDNFSNNNALADDMRGKGNIKFVDGGPLIQIPLEYAENSNYQRYSGSEPLSMVPDQILTSATYSWKQVALTTQITGLEEIQNSGKSKVLDLLETRLKNLFKTFDNNFSADLYSDGTANGGKQVGGLQLLLADSNATGTVGGISRTSWDFWKHYVYSAATDGGVAASATNIVTYMNKVWRGCSQRKEHPTKIYADDNYFGHYEAYLQALQRVGNSDSADAGYANTLKYKGVDVVCDGMVGGECPANHMYFVNADYLQLHTFKGRNMQVLGGERVSFNQDATAKIAVWAGALCISNCRMQGLLKA